MNLVIVRHAHRDTSERRADNGLSEKGRGQARELAEEYRSGDLPGSKIFWTSPKKRCQETLSPIAEVAGLKIRVIPELDEQRENENTREFLERIEKLLKSASAQNETIYLCSHGDFIPHAIEILTGKSVDVSKGQALVLTFSKGRWEM